MLENIHAQTLKNVVSEALPTLSPQFGRTIVGALFFYTFRLWIALVHSDYSLKQTRKDLFTFFEDRP